MTVGPFQRLYDVADLLRAVPRGHEQRIRSVHYNQIPHPKQRHYLPAGNGDDFARYNRS